MAEVNIDALRPNSNVSKDKGKQKIKAVVSSEKIVSTKSTMTQKVLKSFIQEDIKDLKETIIFDWVIPGIKSAFLNTMSMMFFHQPLDPRTYMGSGSKSYYNSQPKTKYGSYYQNGRTQQSKSTYDRRMEDEKIDYRNLVVLDRGSAEKVVDALREEIRETGQASVAQLYELMGLDSNYTDWSWGWVNELDITIQRVYNGFLIKVTEAIYLGR